MDVEYIGQYRILSSIGAGGMGTVYRARHAATDRDVALKLLPHELASDEEFVKRFLREARAVAALNHPHVVTIYDAGFADGQYYIAMELLPGGSLARVMARGKLPEGEALVIARQVAGALDYAHGKGLVHRDIKPANVLIAHDGRYVVTDFGVVHVASESKLTRAASVIGTPEYMSPEQAGGLLVDGRSDLYSLGVMLYQMLAGQVPFKADTPMGVLYQHAHQPPPPLEDVRKDASPAVRALVMRALAKNPADRFQTGSEFVAAIDRVLQPAGTPKAAAKAGLIPIVAVIGGLAALLAAGIIALSRGGPPPATPLVVTVVVSAGATPEAAPSPTGLPILVPPFTATPTGTPTAEKTPTPRPTDLPTPTWPVDSPTPEETATPEPGALPGDGPATATREPDTPTPAARVAATATSTPTRPPTVTPTPTRPPTASPTPQPSATPMATPTRSQYGADGSNWFFTPHPAGNLRSVGTVPASIQYFSYGVGLYLPNSGASFFLLNDGSVTSKPGQTITTALGLDARLRTLAGNLTGDEQSYRACTGDVATATTVTAYVATPDNHVLTWSAQLSGVLNTGWSSLPNITFIGCR